MLPTELMQYKQWVVWKLEYTDTGELTKVPYSAYSGKRASHSDPLTWSDYETACRIASGNYGFNGIGFVLSTNDPYTIIDLDDPEGDIEILERQRQIAERFDSYSEVSPSGRGLHIIVKGDVIEGRRKKKVEVYSTKRYFTMTGWTYQDRPIAERQFLIDQLWSELNTPRSVYEGAIITDFNQPERYTDEQVFRMAESAKDAQKFLTLWNGNYQVYYASQSQGDIALINMIGFYSRNMNQIARMFYLSGLGKRKKAQRKEYVEQMIRKSFDNIPPEIDIDALINNIKEQQPTVEIVPTKIETDESKLRLDFDWTCPPGLLGEISQFIYSAAPRPVKEIALAGAIGLMAGLCGRCYNISGTGLNQYVLVLAKTGTGKEAAASGIDKLMRDVKKISPAAGDFMGPAEIASGQALIKYLALHPCFVSVVGEFGLMLQQICSQNANLAQSGLRRTLLALYNKSGATDVFHPTIYADKDKNTAAIKSPSFSIQGESTPETFYSSLDETMISQGLMPRFTCIEYSGGRPPLNEAHVNTQPPPELVTKLCDVISSNLSMTQNNRTIDVQCDAEATELFRQFNAKCDRYINGSEMEIARQLWNRGDLKAKKLAALIAIGVDPYHPCINRSQALWAKTLVERDILNVLDKFNTGKAGRETNELNQINEVAYIVKDYLCRPSGEFERYGIPAQYHDDHVITHSYLQKRVLTKSSFKHDRIGASNALRRAMESFINDGSMREMSARECMQRYNKVIRCYVILEQNRFL